MLEAELPTAVAASPLDGGVGGEVKSGSAHSAGRLLLLLFLIHFLLPSICIQHLTMERVSEGVEPR